MNEVDVQPLPDGFVIANRYEIDRLLGMGSTGSAYLAADRMLEGCQIAVKVLHNGLVTEPGPTRRFLREVKLLRGINHVNVIRTFDVGQDAGLVYYTMEYISGVTLEDFIQDRQLEVSEVCSIAVQIVNGLQAIHEAGIIHRDLKPGNIILAASQMVKIADFGIAKSASSSLTGRGEIFGSLAYIAPEILIGKEVSHAADYFSLGVTLYEMFTGAQPFEAENPAQLMWLQMTTPAAPPLELRPDLPPQLNALVLALLAKSPCERLQSPEAILECLTGQESDAGEMVHIDSWPGKESSTLLMLEGLEDARKGIIFGAQPTSKEVIEHEARYSGKRRLFRSWEIPDDEESPSVCRRLFLRVFLLGLCALVLIGTVVYQMALPLSSNSLEHYRWGSFAAKRVSSSAPKSSLMDHPLVLQLRLLDDVLRTVSTDLRRIEASAAGSRQGDVQEAFRLPDPAEAVTSPPAQLVLPGIKNGISEMMPDGHFSIMEFQTEHPGAAVALDGKQGLLTLDSEALASESNKREYLIFREEQGLKDRQRTVKAKLAVLEVGRDSNGTNDLAALLSEQEQVKAALRDLNRHALQELKRYRFWSDRAADLAVDQFIPLAQELALVNETEGKEMHSFRNAWTKYVRYTDTHAPGSLGGITPLKLLAVRKSLKQAVGLVLRRRLSLQGSRLLEVRAMCQALDFRLSQVEAMITAMKELQVIDAPGRAQRRQALGAESEQLEAKLKELGSSLSAQKVVLYRAAIGLGPDVLR